MKWLTPSSCLSDPASGWLQYRSALSKRLAMHIRWNRNWNKKGDFIYAILSESRKIDGKFRYTTIKYLGGISENHPCPYRRMRFWKTVEKKMSEVELSPEMLEKVIISLEKRIPKPSDDDLEKGTLYSLDTVNLKRR